MTTAEKIVAVALGQLGVRETGDNAGVPLQRYGLPQEPPAPWCARFVRWVLSEAGYRLPGNQYDLGSVQLMEERFKGLGALVTEPQSGDVVFFKHRIGSDGGVGRHVGIVTGVKKGKIETIEGNSGDKVATRVYVFPCNAIASFGRIPSKES